MLNEPIKIEKKEAKEFPSLPKNIYQSEVLDVNAEKKATYDTRLKPKEEQEMETVLNFQFTLLEGEDKEGKDLRVRNVWANFVPTYLYISKKNGKNKLYKILEALLGRELTQAEEAGGLTTELLNSLVGKQCRISVEPQVKGDNTYDTITDWFTATSLLNALTEEEKETARVKVKKDDKDDNKDFDQPTSEEEPDLSDVNF